MTLSNATPEERRHAHREIVAGLTTGTLQPVVGETFPLEDAARAHHRVLENKSFGKIVLTPGLS